MEKKTALYEMHEKCGGKIVPFAGYLLPVVSKGFFPGEDFPGEPIRCGLCIQVPLIALACAALLLGLFPTQLLGWLSGIASGVL